ncbi:MAG TPA: phage major tail tube protein [Sphingobium sp.]|uniref:phage major tail tube protein n=1 Tax=Sphingobium sp. TaxID=1912891 RepID=UPI002ED382DB
MAIPRTIKDIMLLNDALDYVGECSSLTLPNLARKFEEWRGAGMDSPIKIDMGGEALEMEHSYGGPIRQIFEQYGMTTVAGVGLRFVGSYQNEDSGGLDVIEISVRGRHEEITMGDAKTGEIGEFKVKTALSYYKLDWNGTTLIEIDPINRVLIVNGVDLMATRRAALGV